MDEVDPVKIDNEGKFKYILINIFKDEAESKIIVRGTKDAEFHPDIFAKVEPELKAAGFTCEVKGGGKLIHEAGKSLKVFSKSTGYGKADHSVTVKILKEAFPGYEDIFWTDED